MSRKIENIRNIGIIAHIDAGKTTLTERMLFLSGAKHRIGDVDKGTTETDVDEEEMDRGITIYSACVTFTWRDTIVNLLDTPGHVDFTAEVERCLRVLDGAVVVFSAREGVEAQSETVWRQADKYRVPRIAFINKMDREGADFERVFDEIQTRLRSTVQKVDAAPIAIQIPVGQGPPHIDYAFRGVIDLITMEMLVFGGETNPKEVSSSEIPDDLRDDAEIWRERMLEMLYAFSDEMMELAMAEEAIPVELVRRVVREATLAHQIYPVLCGSAQDVIGVQPVLDAVGSFLPSPLDKPPVEGRNPKKKDALEKRKASSKDPFCALVFKILPEKTGDNYWIRVYSGELKSNSRVFNPDKDVKENVSQLWHIHATRKEPKGKVDTVEAGDIVCVIGPRHSITGDTLAEGKSPITLETIEFPDTVISMAIEPESAAERTKLAETLKMLRRQDPTFDARENEETGQTLISGMGELHLEVIKNRLLRDFNLNVKVHKPRVSYRETIETAAEVTGECHRQIAGTQLFAKLDIRIEPFANGNKPVTIVNRIADGSTPRELVDVAREELESCGQSGGLIGSFPLTKIKITLVGSEFREESSDGRAFRIAANDAFDAALRAAKPVLLEPVMKVQIATPEDYFGEIDNDLQKRRGFINSQERRGELVILEAQAPLSELFGYSGTIRSLSQGRAAFSMEPLMYAPAPPEIAEGFAF